MNSELIDNITKKYPDKFQIKSIAAKELIIEQETKPEKVYWVKHGVVKAFHTNEKGQEFLLALDGAGEIFGEIEFFHPSNHIASVETITNCEIISILIPEFKTILKDENDFLFSITSSLAHKLKNISERTSSYSFFPLEYLLTKFLYNEFKSNSNRAIEINKINMAQYFGTNIRSINRIIKKLSDQKCLEISGEKINIIKPLKILELIKKYT